ncbi:MULTISPECIES: hypothetical protein [Cupriavidus]
MREHPPTASLRAPATPAHRRRTAATRHAASAGPLPFEDASARSRRRLRRCSPLAAAHRHGHRRSHADTHRLGHRRGIATRD